MPDISINQAAQKAKQLAKTYEAVLMIAEVLASVADLDNEASRAKRSTKEAQAAEAKAKSQYAKAEDYLRVAYTKADQVDQQSSEKKTMVDKHCDTLVQNARKEAADILHEANKQHTLIKEKSEYDRVRHNQFMAENNKTQEKLSKTIENMKHELAKIKERFSHE